MRLLLCAAAILLAGLVVGISAPGGDANSQTLGDGCLVVSQGYGKITVTLTRGVIFGRFQSGSLSYIYKDQNGNPSLPRVPGVAPTKVNDRVWAYGPADNVRFRATGPTKLSINAQGIDLSVAGRGVAFLTSAGWDGVLPPANLFSVDSKSFCEESFLRVPPTLTRYPIASQITG
jgi:hypothetical protein